MAANMQVCRFVLHRLQIRHFSKSTRLCKIKAPLWVGGNPFRFKNMVQIDTLPQEKNLAEKLAEGKVEDPELSKSINIGVEWSKTYTSRKERLQIWKKNKASQEMERAARHQTLKVPQDEVKDAWLKEIGVEHLKEVAEHYGIFKHLFGNAFFYPVQHVRIAYDYDEEYVTPVYMGNRVTPKDSSKVPTVMFTGDEGSQYTLLMTNPDGHLTDNNSEYLHWMIGNIRGSDVSSGEVLCDYLQPFPPRGTGFHRHVFVLFKHNSPIDFSKYQLTTNCSSLSERTFKTEEFYRKHQDLLTPVGLNFFQSDYDDSVKDVYHNSLDMREPTFEYRHPPPYHPPQKMYPHRQPFDRYFDRYRDKKDLAEEVLRKRLEMASPFSDYPEKYKYPLAYYEKEYKPSWLKKRQEFMHRRLEQFKDLP